MDVSSTEVAEHTYCYIIYLPSGWKIDIGEFLRIVAKNGYNHHRTTLFIIQIQFPGEVPAYQPFHLPLIISVFNL